MENNEVFAANAVDWQVLCNLLNENGYRLVRVSPTMVDGEHRIEVNSQPMMAVDAQSMMAVNAKRNESFEDFMDPILKREMIEARRRAELTMMANQVTNHRLLEELKRWRLGKARLEGVPVYLVLNNKTLLSIAIAAPATMAELLSVNGFGPAKADKFGQEILDIISREMEVAED